jgi:hypothetical protein
LIYFKLVRKFTLKSKSKVGSLFLNMIKGSYSFYYSAEHFTRAQAQLLRLYVPYPIEPLKNSRFILAMLLSDIPFGHSTSHAPVLVQLPNPSASI